MREEGDGDPEKDDDVEDDYHLSVHLSSPSHGDGDMAEADDPKMDDAEDDYDEKEETRPCHRRRRQIFYPARMMMMIAPAHATTANAMVAMIPAGDQTLPLIVPMPMTRPTTPKNRGKPV